MAEQEENDFRTENDDPDEPILEEPCPICPKCLQPCNPSNDYCLNCDSNEAMNPLATYMPFESIRFIAGIYGKMLRAVFLERQTSWINRVIYSVVLFWAIPAIFIFALPLVFVDRIKNPQLRKAITIVVIVLMALLIVCLVLWLYPNYYGDFEGNY